MVKVATGSNKQFSLVVEDFARIPGEVMKLRAIDAAFDGAVIMISRMNITVLRGGPGLEREVSLVSGAAVAQGLREAGHVVFEADISPDDLVALNTPCDCVFPVLHGQFGEDGQLQEILELRQIPFVGSGSKASKLAIDKFATKQTWQAAGLPTPPFHVARVGGDQTLGSISPPCVVKSLWSGSSIGVFICHDKQTAQIRLQEILDRDGIALVEQFIDGIELTVGVLDDVALPPIRIAYENGFFDYDAKYSQGGARHEFETTLPESLIGRIRADVLKAHRVIGCRQLSRTDVMVSRAGEVFLIEINTIPGFTPRSLLPEAADKAGIPFVQLVDGLVKGARRGA